jgi:ATP-dependent helicase HrpB
VPPALLDLVPGEIVVLEPRRLAARLAARRVAEEQGEDVGGVVGYQVRFEDVTSARTRIRFVTEGLLARRLLSDPTLRGVGAVVLDEFHERHLQGDYALAMLHRLQRSARPDLRLVVMSATLEADPVAEFLGGCATLRAEGRRFDVTVEHADQPDDRPLERQVAAAVKRLVVEDRGGGDILVFLPGAQEIERARRELGELATRHELLVVPLHGDLPAAEQDRAVRPAAQRKVILSTNVAETSVTIEGVGAVVDSGVARIASHSPWTGVPALRLAKISQASAIQRAGRAGRTRAGRCLRLYTRHDFDGRSAHDSAEIRRLDLAELCLELHAAGVADPRQLDWLEDPPDAAIGAAETLLRRLGAVDATGALTETGRRMLRMPLHPRLARLVIEAQARGVAEDGCVIAAWIGERGEKQARGPGGGGGRHATSGPSDLLDALERFRAEPRAHFAVDRAQRQLTRLVGRSGPAPADPDQALQIAILAGFVDRVARRRRPGSSELVLAGGGSAELGDASVVKTAELMVVVDVEERGTAGGPAGKVRVRAASAIDPDWLIDVCPDQLEDERELRWNPAGERVEVVTRLRFGALTLDERTSPPEPREAEAATKVLAQAALAAGPARFGGSDGGEALTRLRARLAFAHAQTPDGGFAPPDDAALARALAARCTGATRFSELGDAPLYTAVWEGLDEAHRRQLDRLAPDKVTLSGGRSIKVHYEPDKPPWCASRLQDFFGMSDGPRAAAGRVPIVLHLLAPNQRAVQVTTDLAGFWDRHYPAIRKELMRQYPRHAWPENPRVVTAPMVRRPK